MPPENQPSLVGPSTSASNDSARVRAEVTIADCAQKIAVNDVPVLGSKTSFAFATMVMAALDRAGLAVVAVGHKHGGSDA